jgi:DNA-binding SARP family transcriptional activator
MLEFRVLGPVEVRDGDRTLLVGGRKPRALLAALLLRVGEEVSAERLIDDLWGERPPQTAKNSLHNCVSALRRTLGAEVLVTRPSGYALEIEPEQVDLERFRRLVQWARAAASDEQRAVALREALELWRGPPLADVAYEPFALLEAPRLEEQRLAAREDLIEAELALGRQSDLLPELEALIEAHPYDERLRAQQMLALYRAGRQADALEAYSETRRFLVDELGLEPSEPLRELQAAMLRQDEKLALRQPAGELLPVRKTVTVLYAEIADAEALAERLDPEALRQLLERTFAAARGAVERHAGIVETLIGDAVLAVFGLPQAHEDDTLRALRAAMELHEARPGEVELRIGVSTGEVFASGVEKAGALVTGAALHAAKRLGEAAAPGEILVGASTYRLVHQAVEAKQRRRFMAGAWVLHRLVEGAPAIPRRLEAPLVGRRRELGELEEAYERALSEGRCVVAPIVGDAGIGKTRLANELSARARHTATVLTGRCVSYGEGATWLPIAEAIRSVAGQAPDDRVARVLAGVLGEDEAASTGETFWGVRRILETLAADRPVVLVLEDVHWAEPTLLDLVEYLEGFAKQAPMLVLCVARPELLDAHPGWAEKSLVLDPLPEADVLALIDDLGGPELDPAVRERVAEVAEGNPLFAEQLLAWAAESGGLDAVPPSVEALLHSRIDRLPSEQRAALDRAAVVGREFAPVTIQALSPPEAVAGIGPVLLELVRAGLLDPAPSRAAREDGFRFHHALVRDVAYAGVPKSDRAELHERAAEWLEHEESVRDELVGYHLEQAYRCRLALGAADRHARALAADAGKRLGDAGIRAWKRGDVPATVNLLTRATSLLPAEQEFLRELLCELGVALRAGGEIDRGKASFARAIDASTAAHDHRVELRARIELAGAELAGNPEAGPDELLTLAGRAIPLFEGLRDDRSLGRTWLLAGQVHGPMRCQNAAWAQASDEARVYYERSGWPPSICLSNLAAALYHGPTPASEGIERCERLLSDVIDLVTQASIHAVLGAFHALRGEFEEARGLVDRSIRIFGDLGHVEQSALTAGWAHGEVELWADDAWRAERVLRENCLHLRRRNMNARLATAAAELAEALHRQGRRDEALQWTRVSERHATPADLSAQIQWRRVRAKILALSDEDAAESLARQALELVEQTDGLNEQAATLVALAEVIGQRSREAVRILERALQLFERKENLIGAERTRRQLAELVVA